MSDRFTCLLAPLLDLVFPPRCVARACRRAGHWLCQDCLDRVRPLPDLHCPRCAEPWPREAGLCAACRADAPDFSGAFCLGLYEGPLMDAVHALKYRGLRAVARPLGAAMAQAMLWADWPPSVPGVTRPLQVLALPSHPRRVLRRGVDHSAALAGALSTSLGWPLAPRRLHRRRATADQVGLGIHERRANVADAFASGPWEGESLLLVDDVLTTGATARAAAAALKRAGAGGIWLATLARAAPAFAERPGLGPQQSL